MHKPLRYAGFRTRVNQPGRVIYNNRLWSILQTGSQRTRVRRTLGPRFVRFAALFYGSLAVVAAVWCGLRGFDVRLIGESLGASALLGGITATCTVFLGLLAWSTAPLRPASCWSRSSPGWVRKHFSGARSSRSSAWWSPLSCSAWPTSAPTGAISYGRRGPYWPASFSVFSTRSAALCSPPSLRTAGTTLRHFCSGNAPVAPRRRLVSSEQAPQHHHGQVRRPLPRWSCAGRSLLRGTVARCGRIRLARGLRAGRRVDLTRGQGHRGEPGGQGLPDLGQAAFRRGA